MNAHKLGEAQTTVASNRYHYSYNNKAYTLATQGKSISYCNGLIDDAMALCGHPLYRLSYRRYSQAAIAFLSCFVLPDFSLVYRRE